jgi:hypothetical protein
VLFSDANPWLQPTRALQPCSMKCGVRSVGRKLPIISDIPLCSRRAAIHRCLLLERFCVVVADASLALSVYYLSYGFFSGVVWYDKPGARVVLVFV